MYETLTKSMYDLKYPVYKLYRDYSIGEVRQFTSNTKKFASTIILADISSAKGRIKKEILTL